MLIGLRDVALLKPLEVRSSDDGGPIAVRSLLGWSIYGPRNTGTPTPFSVNHHERASDTTGTQHPPGSDLQQRYANNIVACTVEESRPSEGTSADQLLHEMLRQYFTLEGTGVAAFSDNIPASKEMARANHLLESTTVKHNGRFTTGLLWAEDDVRFPDSFPMAKRRLLALERKLEKDAHLQREVHDRVHMYIEKGFAHEASNEELLEAPPDRVWYLPVNIVSHPHKPDKNRLVWDAAAKVYGVSLNSKLMKGPDLLVQLPWVLCKFRQRRVGFGGDIEKMFHQVRIQKSDTHSQRFLFRFNQNEPPKTYLMDVATFGATCSPCSAQYVMHLNADQHKRSYPEASAAIKLKTYMDDYFDSCDTVEEANTRAKQVQYIHSQAGFNMRNWLSNEEKALEGMKGSGGGQTKSIEIDQSEQFPRVLGLIWDTSTDTIKFATKWQDELKPYANGEQRPTKRIVLRIVMSLFDPLGLLAPALIHGRIIMQDLWRSGLDWDLELSDAEYRKWQRWVGLLPAIQELNIPRWYFSEATTVDYNNIELHVFTDASELGYGCVAYLRMETGTEVHCSLVMARSKVAPLKHLSIPRLELEAALLGARLMRTVSESLEFRITRKYIHTDSEVVLSWIRSPTRDFKQFVACRVGEILALTELKHWRHVPSKENPADYLTKWCKETAIQWNGMWLKGPSFLYKPEEAWPPQKSIEPTAEEQRGHVMTHAVVEDDRINLGVTRFSKWRILVRTVAILHRFVTNCKRKVKGLPILSLKATKLQQNCIKKAVPAVHTSLSSEEYEQAEGLLWRFTQEDTFPSEVRKLRADQRKGRSDTPVVLERSSPLYNITPFADEHGVLRVNSRVCRARQIDYNVQYPIILPRDHPVTRLLISDHHHRFGHANRETVVNELRQRFFTKHLRACVSSVMEECQHCKIRKCQPSIPRMAPLPEARLTPHIRPFCTVGIDYLGPLEVINARRKEKRYVAVFTCLVTRALHLEVAHSLSTEACIMAIRRFISRRGPPKEIYSDNGTNFIGANNELQKQIAANHYSSADTFTDTHTTWRFNPPSAPHMGGVWERMVRSVKEAMNAFNDGGRLNDEILLTVLADSESLINSRPLTYMPQASSDSEALTPNHFILGSSIGRKEQVHVLPHPAEALRSSYQRAAALTHHFWDRWLKEYVPTLHRRTKWIDEGQQLEVGALVFVTEGARSEWLRAKVEEVFPGRDGRVRQAVVRTANGRLLKRPVVKLARIDAEMDRE